MTKEELIAFEADIADIYNSGVIKAPIHLSGGNEDQLLEIFKEVNPDDWVFSTWRSHYHCLLKGVPPDILKADILAGKSITLNYPKYKVFTSAIVGGIIPIALGAALQIQRSGKNNKVWVWCFVGDMTALTGIFVEASRLAIELKAPITFVIENNGKSVGTPTANAWGAKGTDGFVWVDFDWAFPIVRSYEYKLPWPHAGAGKWINF